jgi:predicted RNA-binding Zn-ribbon protein involved in translation (DUF1610 family)
MDARTRPDLVPPCPQCGQPHPRWLEFTSTKYDADTFQCLACGKVWIAAEPRTREKASLTGGDR